MEYSRAQNKTRLRTEMGRMSLMGLSVGGHVKTYLLINVLKNCVKMLQVIPSKNKTHSRGPMKNSRIVEMPLTLVNFFESNEDICVLMNTEKNIAINIDIHTSMISSALH